MLRRLGFGGKADDGSAADESPAAEEEQDDAGMTLPDASSSSSAGAQDNLMIPTSPSRKGHVRSISEVTAQSSTAGEEYEVEEEQTYPEMQGVLSKWTNYIHGWQSRFVELRNGILSYYKSEDDKSKFCRGTIDVSIAIVYTHEFDQLRFDVSVSDSVYYLRVTTEEQREQWVKALNDTKSLAGGGLLTRRSSQLSLVSVGSTASASKNRDYADKFMEVRSFRDALVNHLNTMHERVTVLVNGATDSAAKEDMQPSLTSAKNDIMTLKATTAGLLESLNECIDLMSNREEDWQRKIDRANDRRRRAEEAYQSVKEKLATTAPNAYGGPDMQEGPHSAMNEDEFYDALETGLDALDAETALLEQLEDSAEKLAGEAHRFQADMQERIAESLKLLKQSGDANSWVCAHQDGDMEVYRCEIQEDGKLIDRLKANCVVPRVTAKEFVTYFYSPDLKMDWEHTIERWHVLERLDEETYIGHALHKRVWPVAQRESVLISHLTKVDGDRWAAQNYSVDHQAVPSEKYVRITCNMFMIGETKAIDPSKPMTRDNVSCHVTYMAYLNPGGWAPPAAVRAVSQREYPKFLRNITKHSQAHYKDKDVQL